SPYHRCAHAYARGLRAALQARREGDRGRAERDPALLHRRTRRGLHGWTHLTARAPATGHPHLRKRRGRRDDPPALRNRAALRRVATAGFIGINIDLAARDGGAAKLTDQAAYNAALAKRTIADKNADHDATITFLKGQSSGSVGVTGFCFGGGEVWSMLAGG